MRFESKAEEEGFALVEITSSGEEQVWTDDMTIEQVEATIVEEYHYDPFGMNLVGIEKAGDNRFQYNQQSEKQQDPTGNGYFYETPLRQYDPQLGRFGGVDLLAEEYATMSPYQYGANNPILFSDPTGARPAPISCDCWGYGNTGGFGLDARMFGRVRINTIGGSYTTSDGVTHGGGGYTSTYGTANNRMDAMYGEAKAEQALQTLAQGWGGSYSNGNLYFSYGSAYTSNYRPNGNIGIIHNDYIQVNSTSGLYSNFADFVSDFGKAVYLAENSLLAAEKYYDYALAQKSARAASIHKALNYSWVPKSLKNSASYLKGMGDGIKVISKGLSRPLLVVGLVSSGISIADDPSTSNIVWNVADMAVSTGAFLVGTGFIAASAPVAAIVGTGAAIYFAGRFAYDIYNAVNK